MESVFRLMRLGSMNGKARRGVLWVASRMTLIECMNQTRFLAIADICWDLQQGLGKLTDTTAEPVFASGVETIPIARMTEAN